MEWVRDMEWTGSEIWSGAIIVMMGTLAHGTGGFKERLGKKELNWGKNIHRNAPWHTMQFSLNRKSVTYTIWGGANPPHNNDKAEKKLKLCWLLLTHISIKTIPEFGPSAWCLFLVHKCDERLHLRFSLQKFCRDKYQNSTCSTLITCSEEILPPLFCLCVFVFLYLLSTKIHILQANSWHFWELRAFWLVIPTSKDYLRLKTVLRLGLERELGS